MSIKVILLLEIIKKKVHLRKSFVYLSQTKGQLISKCLFGIINSPKKQQKFRPLQCYLKLNCFCSFFGRIEDIKRTFQN